MRKRFLLLSGILLVIVIYGYAQELPTIKRPPPSAMRFQKYGDYPVSHFTGVPDISIPLYTIKEGDIEIPITLSYHTSGFKPTDVDGIVGYGWVLNVGGQITRTVYDSEDERNSLYLSNNQPFPTADYVTNFLTPFNDFVDAYLGEIESRFQYDIFSYDFLEKHGKFIAKDFDFNQCLLLDYQPLSIKGETGSTQINSFTVKDETGKKYVFGERNTNLGTNTSDFWSLSSIQSGIDPTNIVTYSYTHGPTTTYMSREDTYYKDDNESDPTLGTCQGSPWPIDIRDHMPNWSDQVYTSYNENGSDCVVPLTINFNSGRIQFFYDPATKMLSAMDVYTSNNELLKRIRFDLYRNTGGRAYYFLGKLKFYDRNDNFINQYAFNYNNGSMVTEYGESVDYWGYANENQYEYLIPRFFIEFFDLYGNAPSKVVGNNPRRSSERVMKAYQLNEIIHPTGGKTVFEFEANQYDGSDGALPLDYGQTQVGGLRIKRILNYSDANTLVGVKDYEYPMSRMDIIPSRKYFTKSSMRYILDHSMGNVYNYRRTIVSSEPLVNITPHGSPVVYPLVREHIRRVLPDGTIDMNPPNAQTISYSYEWEPFDPYSFPETNGPEGGDSYPLYAPYTSIVKAYTDGKLDGISYSGPTTNSIYYDYEEIPLPELHTFYSSRYAFYQSHPCPVNTSDPDWWYYAAGWGTYCHLNYGDVTIKPVNRRLKSITETKQGVTTYTEFDYNNNIHNQPTSKTVTTSTGETIKTTYQYPHEKQSGTPNVYNALVARHIWNPVVEEAIYKAGSPDAFLKSTTTNYDYWENNSWSAGSTNSLIVPRTVQTKVGTNNLETRITFHAYDNKANIVSVAKENNMKLSYLWGYDQQYPIAEVADADFKDIFHTSFEDESGSNIAVEGKTGKKSKTDGFTRSLTNLTNGSYTLSYWLKSGGNWAFSSASVNVTGNAYTINISGQVDEVRFYPSTAQITTFTFDPLVGKTSETSINNSTEYYEYDAALRLTHILDDDRNILKKYSYSFHNTESDAITAPNWQNTGNGYCEACSLNPTFLSGYRMEEQIDNNSNSYTSGQKRWYRERNSSLCGTFDDFWQNTDNYNCVKDGGINTGELQRQQVFINPCYSQFLQTRWVSLGQNTGTCPVPSVYLSQDLSGNYRKSNCGDDYIGSEIYVSVPEAMFSSPTSLQDANNQARAWAQYKADTDPSGQCTPIPFMLQCENWSDDAIEVSLYHHETQTTYAFIIQDNHTNYQDLGYILPGTYDVTFINLDYDTEFGYYLNCGNVNGVGNAITFEDVTIGSSCNQIQVYP